jgi:hypothetical protein
MSTPILSDDHLSGAPLNAGDRAEQLNGLLERGDLLPDRLRQRRDLLVEEVEVREDRANPNGSSNSSSRIAQTGFQNTPVASIVTCVTP